MVLTIIYKTLTYVPDNIITIRNDIDGWAKDVDGTFKYADSDNPDAGGEWTFTFTDEQPYHNMQFKFMLNHLHFMLGENIEPAPDENGVDTYSDTSGKVIVTFPWMTEIYVENGRAQRAFFPSDPDAAQPYDVIVVGSGMGGGVVADQLADRNVRVLVLEAGSLLFPTHTGNLPRQHHLGKLDKNVWDLWGMFQRKNFININPDFKSYQAFNLGGRSIFWGALIPRMRAWEMDAWPAEIKADLLQGRYQQAEDLMNRSTAMASTNQPWRYQPSPYQHKVKNFLGRWFQDQDFGLFQHLDAPLALQSGAMHRGAVPKGLFSTADLLTEWSLTEQLGDNRALLHPELPLTFKLNHAVRTVTQKNKDTWQVTARNLISQEDRTFEAKFVVLAAGTIESPKIVAASGLAGEQQDPLGLLGKGITDHPILVVQFAIPESSPYYERDGASKTLSQCLAASPDNHPYNMVMELGADLNQGRFVDPAWLIQEELDRGKRMLCELVFLFYSDLMSTDTNHIDFTGAPDQKSKVTVARSNSAKSFRPTVEAITKGLLNELEAEAIDGRPRGLDLQDAPLGGVSHEVGTLRISNDAKGVKGLVDANLRLNGYRGLYVCDLSVFPAAPAANPSLTLVALAIRLAEHIRAIK